MRARDPNDPVLFVLVGDDCWRAAYVRPLHSGMLIGQYYTRVSRSGAAAAALCAV